MNFSPEDGEYKHFFIDEDLLFGKEWYDQNPLRGWEDNPFLPKEIANRLSIFQFGFPYPVYEERYKSVVVVDLDSFDKSIVRQERTRSSHIRDHHSIICKDFRTFHKACNDLSKEIEKWLKKHDAADLNFRNHF